MTLHRPIPTRILVTGGAGFIGSHLCDRLLGLGHEVLCLDNFLTGHPRNIAHLRDHPRFELVRHDVTVPLELEVGAIYNLACPASPVQYQRDPIRTTRISVLGTLNMLDLATRLGCPILQASTSEVYGDPDQHPQPERYWGHVNPIGPRACYDEGKRVAETLVFDHHRQHGLEVKIARIFNTYGPRMQSDDGRVVSNFIVAALRGGDITIYGGGQQSRSFCYVDDLVTGLVALMETDAAVTGPINLGNPRETTILSLAEQILSACGSGSRLQFAPLPQDDPRQRCPDIARAREVLGWAPEVSLEAGLARTITWFRASEDTPFDSAVARA